MKYEKCENCTYARLVASEKNRKEYVGCLKTDGLSSENKEKIIDYLDNIKYTGKTIAKGWIYGAFPDSVKPENGYMFSTCLLVEKKAICNFFKKRL